MTWANRVLPIVLGLREGKMHGDPLLTTECGVQLHRSAVLRSVHWSTTGQGTRIHDLRHTAAAGQTGFPGGGAAGVRTPDLLIAKAFRVLGMLVVVLGGGWSGMHRMHEFLGVHAP